MHDQPCRPVAARHRLVVLIQTGLQQSIGQGIELGLVRLIVGLVHPVHHPVIGDATVDCGQLQNVERFVVGCFGPQQFCRVVAGEVRPGEVTIGDLAGEPLCQRQAHRLRHGGQENPEVMTFHK